jgi:hypothetical protein
MASSLRWVLSLAMVVSLTGLEHRSAAADSVIASQGEGWSVQFCTGEIEAPSVGLDVGADSNSREDWMTWNTSQAPKQLVPEKYRHVREIWIEGKAMPSENDVVFCVKYNGVARRHFDFDDTEDHKVKTDRHEGECKC